MFDENVSIQGVFRDERFRTQLLGQFFSKEVKRRNPKGSTPIEHV